MQGIFLNLGYWALCWLREKSSSSSRNVDAASETYIALVGASGFVSGLGFACFCCKHLRGSTFQQAL